MTIERQSCGVEVGLKWIFAEVRTLFRAGFRIRVPVSAVAGEMAIFEQNVEQCVSLILKYPHYYIEGAFALNRTYNYMHLT